MRGRMKMELWVLHRHDRPGREPSELRETSEHDHREQLCHPFAGIDDRNLYRRDRSHRGEDDGVSLLPDSQCVTFDVESMSRRSLENFGHFLDELAVAELVVREEVPGVRAIVSQPRRRRAKGRYPCWHRPQGA